MSTYKIKFMTPNELGVFTAYIRASSFREAFEEAERTLAIDELLAIVRTENEIL